MQGCWEQFPLGFLSTPLLSMWPVTGTLSRVAVPLALAVITGRKGAPALRAPPALIETEPSSALGRPSMPGKNAGKGQTSQFPALAVARGSRGGCDPTAPQPLGHPAQHPQLCNRSVRRAAESAGTQHGRAAKGQLLQLPGKAARDWSQCQPHPRSQAGGAGGASTAPASLDCSS